MGTRAQKPRVGLSEQRYREIVRAELEGAEEQRLHAELALAQAEEVEDLLREGEDSKLEDCKRDVEAWNRRVTRLRKDYFDDKQERKDA